MPKEKAEEKVSESSPKSSGGGGKGLLVVVILLLLIIIAGGAGFFLFLNKGQVANVGGQQPFVDSMVQSSAAPMSLGAVSREDPGPIQAYPPFLVNLADPGGNRYLKITVSIELSKDKNFPAEVTAKEPRIKDIIISVVTSKTFDEVSTFQGKVALKQEMIRRLNAIMSNGRVTDVYITEFIVQ